MGTLPFPIFPVVGDLISNSKRKDKFGTNGYKELHQDHTCNLHSPEVVVRNGSDLEKLKSRKRKRNKKQRKAKQNNLEIQDKD